MMKPNGAYSPLGSIRYLGTSAFSENMARDLQYLNYLDCDRMLYNFKETFGVPTDAEPIYGWDSPDGLLRGHSTGHYLSALAIAYSATGDEKLRQKLDKMVHELHALQALSHGNAADFHTACTPEDCAQDKWSTDPAVWGEGFLSAYSPDQFALLEQFTRYANIWAPYYTLHKLLAGLVEAYERAGNEEALETACGIGKWVYNRLSPLSAEHRKKMWSLYIAGEFGGMNETLARLAILTDDPLYLDCAKMFDNENIFPGLARGEDTIQNLHANQHIPQILGAILEYEACGDKTYYDIARNFFDIVTKHHMYSIGGVGQGESFRDADRLAHFIKKDTNCETCATYNLLKLARELYAFDPENAAYMDYYERGMINHILASQCPHHHRDMMHGVTYMLPIGPGAEKSYSNDYWAFTCCHGTGMENHVKYPDAQYFTAEKDGKTVLYINQYLPTELCGDHIAVKCDVRFPFGVGTITLSGDKDYLCKLRIPAWCEQMPFFDGSGAPLTRDKSNERYVSVEHRAGETVVLSVSFGPYTVRYEETMDTLEQNGEDVGPLVSVLYGPFVMVTGDKSQEYLSLPQKAEYRAEINKEAGAFSLNMTDAEEQSIKRAFIPMYTAHDMPYHTYFKK